MTDERVGQQLSFDVGRALGDPPATASFTVSGRICSPTQELDFGDGVQVLIMGADGEVIVSAFGQCEGVAFKRHETKDGVQWVERQHTIKLP